MIIKSLARKGNKRSTVKQLMNYLLQEHKKGDFVLLHNIQGTTIDEYTDAFMSNEKNRLHVRKNTTILNHSIISMHYLDTEKLTESTLRKIAREYIKLRNIYALYVVVPHFDKQSIHLHIAMSGVEQHKGLSTRISQKDFRELKSRLQDKFPELVHSVVDHSRSNKSKSEREFQLIKRTNKETEKEKMKALLEKAISKSTSKQDFYARLENEGIQVYERNGVVTGVIGKRKMRFTTIGFDIGKIKNLDLFQEFQETSKKSIFHEKGLSR